MAAVSLDDPMLQHNLPFPVTSFVGRAGDVRAVQAALARSRLVTLTGPGGIGKTRLAVQVATELLDSSPGGAWLAEFAELTDPGLVVPTAAAATGVQETPGRPLLDTLIAALRHRELLIVLDNCEHVITACAELAAAVLRHCAGVRLLATSREPLRVAGEQVHQVPPLALPTAGQLAGGSQALAGIAAIRLFLDRAAAHQPAFTLDQGTAAAVASVCRQLDGLPLAIELAAARLRSLGVADIERRLDDRFRLLAGGDRSALPRQQTLHALVDWSYELLTGPERTVLHRISVFAGAFDLAAAEEVAADSGAEVAGVVDAITSLVDKSLLQLEPGAPTSRYRLLETVRHYAAQRLAGDPAGEQAARERHAAVFLRLAGSAEPHLDKAGEAAWQERLAADNANLGTAFRYLNGLPDRGDDLLRLAGTLYRFSVTRGAVQEHLGMLRTALGHPSAQQPTAARARALLATASAVVRAGGDRGEARELQLAALAIARDLGEPGLTAAILGSLAVSIAAADDTPALARATALAGEAVLLSRSSGSPDATGQALKARSAVHSFAMRLEEACQDNEEAAGLFLSTGNRKGLCRTLNNLASDEIVLRRFGDAQRHLQEAIPYAAADADTSDLAYVLGNLSLVSLLRGDPAAARGPALEALRNIQTDDRRALYAPVLYLALCHSAAGQPEPAAVLHGAVDAMHVALEPAERELCDEDHRKLTEQLGAAILASLMRDGHALRTAGDVLSYAISIPDPGSAADPEPEALARLSSRERELVTLVARGQTDAQIAGQLFISVRTVRSHLDRIRDKSGCRRRADLTRLALQGGLI